MKLLILNGPNINLLGIREPAIYGSATFADLCTLLETTAQTLGVDMEHYQSNSEGDLVTKIQQAYGQADGIVINPAAYTHTSVAILDALKAVGLPAVEVHISDPMERESFRHWSYPGQYCERTIRGRGIQGYAMAMEYLVDTYG